MTADPDIAVVRAGLASAALSLRGEQADRLVPVVAALDRLEARLEAVLDGRDDALNRAVEAEGKAVEQKERAEAVESRVADLEERLDISERARKAERAGRKAAEAEVARLREALTEADVPLGRIGSSEPLSAQDYRRLGVEARDIVRRALAAEETTSDE